MDALNLDPWISDGAIPGDDGAVNGPSSSLGGYFDHSIGGLVRFIAHSY